MRYDISTQNIKDMVLAFMNKIKYWFRLDKTFSLYMHNFFKFLGLIICNYKYTDDTNFLKNLLKNITHTYLVSMRYLCIVFSSKILTLCFEGKISPQLNFPTSLLLTTLDVFSSVAS